MVIIKADKRPTDKGPTDPIRHSTGRVINAVCCLGINEPRSQQILHAQMIITKLIGAAKNNKGEKMIIPIYEAK